MGMKVSVSLCTYNGEQYLCDQLDSILSQTRQPDEIVVCDDGSTDKTITILREYASEYSSLFTIYENSDNLGPDKNFEQAISRCTGDVIAVCDQDDVWHDEKLERQIKHYTEEDAGLIFHNSTVASESLEPQATLWQSITPAFEYRDRQPAEHVRCLSHRNYVQGATMLFESSLRDYCLPIPENCMYDYWIARIAAVVTRVSAIDETLLIYRQHDNQIVGAGGGPNSVFEMIWNSIHTGYSNYQSSAKQWSEILNRIKGIPASETEVDKEFAVKWIRGCKDFTEARANIYSDDASVISRTRLWLRNIMRGHYSAYQNGAKSAAKDGARVATSIGYLQR